MIPNIGLQNERSLHSALKKWYSKPGDKLEAKVDNYIIDIVRKNELIEIQTKSLAKIRNKLLTLSEKYQVRLVYPIAQEKQIIVISEDGEILRSRKSPKRGKLLDIFDEVVRITGLFQQMNFTLEVLLIKEEEIRCDDGKGSWRRKGISIFDRKLKDVEESIIFQNKKDFQRFIPVGLEDPFSTKSYAKELQISIYKTRRIIYALKKIGTITQVGKKGNLLLYNRTELEKIMID